MHTVPIGATHPTFDDVREIAVLRGGGLGDLLFAIPAIDALAAAYPQARITLLGTPLARALLTGRPSSVAEVVVLPVVPGVRDVPGTESDPAEVRAFLDDMRARRFDLAVQVHGGGRHSNPFLLELGARHTVGTATEDAEVLERWVRYVYYQHEVVRALEVAGLAGAGATTLDPVIVVPQADRDAAAARVVGMSDSPGRAGAAPGTSAPAGRVVAIHPGATDPRRRWPEERFAEVAAARVLAGDTVVLVGDGSDVRAAATIAALTSDLVGAGGARGEVAGTGRVLDLSGQLSIGELAAVLAVADVMVADDSGPRHLAVAVGTCTVGIFWFGNVINAGPFDRGRHRVRMAFVTHCPVCGRDVTQVGWTAERCEHDPSFVAGITADEVLADVDDLLAHAVPVSVAVPTA